MSERNLSADTAQTLSTRATGALQHVDIDAARTTLRQAQTALAALGYDVGDHGDPAERIDGIWSEHTPTSGPRLPNRPGPHAHRPAGPDNNVRSANCPKRRDGYWIHRLG